MQDIAKTAMIPELRRVFKRLHYPLEVMLVCALWYAAYPLSFRHLEEMMQERGAFVDHSTVHRWALKIFPIMAFTFVAASALSVPVGGWMSATSKLQVNGSTCTVQSI
jgi:transposase-like protein